MKYYRKRQKKTDPVQVLKGGDCSFQIIDPLAEQSRRDEDQKLEEQIEMNKSSLPEDIDEFDEKRLPHHPDEANTDHGTFMKTLIAFIVFVLFIASVIIYSCLK